jgi:hypothetical protein
MNSATHSGLWWDSPALHDITLVFGERRAGRMSRPSSLHTPPYVRNRVRVSLSVQTGDMHKTPDNKSSSRHERILRAVCSHGSGSLSVGRTCTSVLILRNPCCFFERASMGVVPMAFSWPLSSLFPSSCAPRLVSPCAGASRPSILEACPETLYRKALCTRRAAPSRT